MQDIHHTSNGCYLTMVGDEDMEGGIHGPRNSQWLCSVNYKIMVWLYCVLLFKIFLSFLKIIGYLDLFLEFMILCVDAFWYALKFIVHWVVPRKRKNIKGLTALVTGAGHGIGKHIAMDLARKGVKVILWDIDKNSIDSVVKDIERQEGQAFSYCCDVSKKEEVYATAKKVQLQVGGIDILVNNAGIVTGQKFLQSSDESILKLMGVNVMAHFWTCKAFLGPMMDRNHGNVVAIASIMGLIGSSSLVDYCASKSAVIRMMDALRQEVIWEHKDGVFFTTVLPSKVDTGMFDGAQGRFSWFPPILKPEYVSRKVIDAIQRDEVVVVLPPWLTFASSLKFFLPSKILDSIIEFLWLDVAMKDFTGHKKDI